jgi:hypothetical protein
LRVALWLVLVAAICVSEPDIFRLGLRQALKLEAMRLGFRLEIGELTGSLFHPIAFRNVKISRASRSGIQTRLAIASAKAAFSLENLVFRRGSGWWKSLEIDGLDCEVQLSGRAALTSPQAPAAVATTTGNALRYLTPSRIDARGVNLLVRQNDDFLRLRDARFGVSEVTPGQLRIEEVVFHRQELEKTFSAVQGATAVQDTKFSVANMTLAPGLVVEQISTDLADLAGGKLAVDFGVAAFGGTMRGVIKGDERNGGLEINGSFAHISVASLAEFLESPETATGTVQEGKFSFRGSPYDLARATLSTRFEATDFSWGKRRWNSLVVGATMVDRRIQIPEFKLVQAHNELNAKGELTLPNPGSRWWQSDFSFDIAARINNLSELSALLGPGFAETAGKATVDGSIRGQNQFFTGQLVVSGSRLSYRTAPLEKLQATIKLNGNELQLTQCEFTHDEDYLRGHGVVNIIGDKRYWGELKASVRDLTLYSAFMEKPIVPAPLAGGLALEWSGDGTAKAHSGAFHAQLRKIRLIEEKSSHPVNADLEATYSPGNIFFSKFLVSDAESYFSSVVTVGPKLLNLQSVLLQISNDSQLDGSALLPVDVWTAWRNASWSDALDPDGACNIHLNAKNLDLRKASLLSGRELPLAGELQVTLATGGTLKNLNAEGRVQLARGQFPLGKDGSQLSGVDASLSLAGQTIAIDKIRARLGADQLDASGQVDLKNIRDPELKIAFQSRKFSMTAMEKLKLDASVNLQINGPLSSADVTGSAELLGAQLVGDLDLVPLLTPGKQEMPPPFAFQRAPFSCWRFDVECRSASAVGLRGASGVLQPHFSIRGAGAAPSMAGTLDFENVKAGSPFASFLIDDGTIYFNEESPRVPGIRIRGSGTAGRYHFTASILGPITQRSVILFSEPPLSQNAIMNLISRGLTETSAVDLQTGFDLHLNQTAPPEAPAL